MMNKRKAQRQAEIGATYIGYCKAVDPNTPANEQDCFHAACAMAISHNFLDLQSITPRELIQPMIRQLQDWHGHTHISALSAIDRLNGLYGMCAMCGEHTQKEIGGFPVQSYMRFAQTASHVCNGCRLDLMVNTEVRLERAA